LTYRGLSNSEGGEKRKDRDGLHDGNGERKERGSGGETTSPAAPDVQYVRALVRRVEGWRGGARKVTSASLTVEVEGGGGVRRRRRRLGNRGVVMMTQVR
jgi:hypothetical protein